MKYSKTALIMLSVMLSAPLTAQTNERTLTVEDLFRLVEAQNPTLAVSKADVAVAKQQVEVAKKSMLPSLTAGVQQYYIGNATILDTNFSDSKTVKMPHYGSTYSADASELLWKGGAVRNGIKIQTLRGELSEFSYANSAQNVKLAALSYYLDLTKIANQEDVYRQNIELAEKRLENIQKFYKQGMVTRNDVIRGQLQISNLNLALEVLQNNRQILNKQLTVALGLPDDEVIKPNADIGGQEPPAALLDEYRNGVEDHPAVKMTQIVVDIQEVNKKITKSEMVPSVAAFAGNRLARPVTSSSPAIDMYSNGWSAGLALSWNIDALYKAPAKLKQNELEKEKAIAQQKEVSDNIGTAVDAAYIKYNEALSQKKTLLVNKNLAYENYRIINSKYENQLAILLDLIDASNAKLDADLQYSNAEINVVYSYYKLLKESGKL